MQWRSYPLPVLFGHEAKLVFCLCVSALVLLIGAVKSLLPMDHILKHKLCHFKDLYEIIVRHISDVIQAHVRVRNIFQVLLQRWDVHL